MEKLQVAVIGCGTIANVAHLPAYTKRDDVQIKYFCDIIPERAEKAAKEYGSGTVVTDYKTILDDPELTAVSVCTPNNVHASISIDFLRAGKHVLCEKPCARTLAEAEEMQKVQHETGKILNIGVCNRFNTAVGKIKEIIDAGELGEVYHVYISFCAHRSIPGLGGAFTTKAIAGGGALIDWGVHFLDIVMYCCGDPAPLTVTGQAFSKLGNNIEEYTYKDMWAGPPIQGGTFDVDDSVTGMIRTAGPVITLNGAWARNIGEDEKYIDFIGDKGGIRLMYGEDFTIYAPKNGMLTKTGVSMTTENMYEVEIDSFLNCVRTGQKNAAHIDTAIITSRIMQTLYDSSDARKEIALG